MHAPQRWADLPLRFKGLAVAFVPVLSMIWLVAPLAVLLRSQQQAERTVERTLEVQRHLETSIKLLVDAETGVRGFLLTGDPTFFGPYDAAVQQLPQQFATLQSLISDRAQLERLDSVRALATRRLAQLAEFVSSPSPPPVSRLVEGKELMETIRAKVSEMDAAEDDLLLQRRNEARTAYGRIWALVAFGVVLGTAVGFGATQLFARGVVQRIQAIIENADRLAHGEPLVPPRPSKDEVGRLGRHLGDAAVLLDARTRAIDEARKELDSFFTLSLDMLCIASSEGYFKRVSPAFTQTLGWSTEDLLTRPFLDFVHPDDVEPTLRELERLAVAGEVLVNFENRYRHKDGAWRVLSWKLVSQPGGFIYATARDVTERKQYEETLKGDEQRLSLALDSGEMGAWELDLVHDTAIRTLKHDQIFGYQSLQPQWGAEIFMGHVFPEDRELVRNAFDAAFANDRLWFECRIIWKDQSLHWIAADGLVYRDQKGAPLRMLGVVVDITKRKRAEEQIAQLNADLHVHAVELTEANKELESFSYSVSHDLRAPLRHVTGFASLLTQSPDAAALSEQGRQYLSRILQATTRMGRLIDDLLAFSRIGRAGLTRSRVDLNSIVRDVQDEVAADLNGRRVVWRVHELPEVEGDTAMLRLVFVNLLSNALKYSTTRAQPEIEIGATPGASGETIVFVRDNGVGFDMQYVDKLFGVFQRLHTHDAFEGTGIGLANVRRIVQRHGGRTWAEGVLDRGATFFFTLPGDGGERNDDRAEAHSAG